jgi:hypothetical protein
MRKGRSIAARPPKKPTEAGAVLVRKFGIKLFDRDEGAAANWPLIADTLFRAAFDALDRSPDDASRAALLRRVNAGSYDRLAADPAASKTQALGGQNEAAPADLQSPVPGRSMRSGIPSEQNPETIATMLFITFWPLRST